ncbi:unnamed protein product [Fusarium graminearum]|nr:unnamed protein product [Fusarium graminearum]
MVILISLSLGVIAGLFGIKRTLEVPELKSPNHTSKCPFTIVDYQLTSPYPLQTIGGGVLQAKRVDRNGSGSTADTNEQVEEHERKMGVNGPFTRTRVYPKIDERRIGGDQSEEEILGPEFRRSQIMDFEAQNGRTMSTRHTNNSERSI